MVPARSALVRGELQLPDQGRSGWRGGSVEGRWRWRTQGVSKVCPCLLWEGTWMGGLAGGAFPQRNSWVGWAVSKVSSTVLPPAGVPVFVLRGGRRKGCPASPLFLGKSPKDPCPSSTCPDISKQISPRLPQAFFKLLLLCCISVGLFVILSLSGWRLSFLLPSTSPRVQPTDF